jgi:hypothetical protein
MMKMTINIKKQLHFVNWWNNEGSALRPLDCEDMETHAYRISNIAWTTANNDLIERMKLTFNNLLHAIENRSEDSLKDIINDAFLSCNMPFISDKDYVITDFNWNT